MNTVLKLEKKFDEKKNRVLETNKRLMIDWTGKNGKLNTTGRAYVGYIKKFFDVDNIDHLEYDAIYHKSDSDVAEFLNEYINRGCVYNTVNKIRCSIASYYEMFIFYHESNGIEYKKQNIAKAKWVSSTVNSNASKVSKLEDMVKLTKEHALAYKNAITNKQFEDKQTNYKKIIDRDLTVLILGSMAGLRREEIISVKAKHVIHIKHTDRYYVRVVDGKGNKSGDVEISEGTYNTLSDHIVKYSIERDDYIVGRLSDNKQIKNADNLNDWWSKYDSDVVVAINPHDLRRIFAGTLFNAKYTLEEIRILMRHSSVTQTQEYLNKCGLVSNRKNEISL